MQKEVVMGRPTHKVPRQGGLASFPSLVTLALWQLRQTWRLLLISGMGIIAAVLLVCAVPLYSQVAISAALRDALNSSPANSSIAIHSSALLISHASIHSVEQQLNQEMQRDLGQFVDSGPQFVIQSQGIPFSSCLSVARRASGVGKTDRCQDINKYDQVQLIGTSMQ